MLLVLPPSETKRDGGDVSRALAVAALGFPSLTRPRRTTLAALRRLARNRETMATALGIGPGLAYEIERNRSIGAAPTMPAIERYTGVLYDALDATSLPASAAAIVGDRVAIHSALFGLIRADDAIPAYRLSHDSRFPDIRLKSVWAGPISRVLDEVHGLVVDMRSEAYSALGPLVVREDRVVLRVVAESADGSRRALTHFNKKGKGEFARAVLESDLEHPDVDSLLRWASVEGIRLDRAGPGELQLVVDEVVAAPLRRSTD